VNLLRQGKATEAAAALAPFAQKDDDNQIAHLFEYGTALQAAGDFKTSNEIFLKAETLTDIKDYHSLSRISGSILLNEGMVQYKGEDYEKVFLNAMLALNFLQVGDFESAQVETRKLNDKLYKYKFEAKRNYEQNPFAFYLSAMIWEANRQWDDAYIDYKKAYEVAPEIEALKSDLPRLAKLAHRRDEAERWKKEFGAAPVKDIKNIGEVILIFEQGWAPRKYPHPQFPRIPKLYPSYSQTDHAKLIVDGVGEKESEVISSVQEVAIKTLDDAYGELIAKRAAGIVAKAVVADQIRQRDELLGAVAWIGMNLADQADLRQWVTLPQTFQVARLAVPPGEHKVQALGIGMGGTPSGESMPEQTVVLKKGEKKFLVWRAFQ
jgi:uncharacterized protein